MEGDVSFTTDEIHSLMDRLARALERPLWAFGPYADLDELAAELDAVTASLTEAECETVGRYLEAVVGAGARD